MALFNSVIADLHDALERLKAKQPCVRHASVII